MTDWGKNVIPRPAIFAGRGISATSRNDQMSHTSSAVCIIDASNRRWQKQMSDIWTPHLPLILLQYKLL